MITAFVLYFISLLVELVLLPFRLLTWVVPDQIPSAFATFFSYVYLGNGVFPMVDILLAMGTLFAAWALIYNTKVFLFVWGLIPWVGQRQELPTHSSHVVDLRKGSFGRNTVDLRGIGRKTRS